LEVDAIRQKANSRGTRFNSVEGMRSTTVTVVEALKNTNCVHFACHGHQDHTGSALGSALFLYDGLLPLLTIASIHLPKANFAFLSACHTATGSNSLPDEAMHIAAGMQVAGFRSVIATMWSIGDDTGPRVAESVYEDLFRNLPEDFDSSEAALALNIAISKLRKGPSKLLSPHWIPFIHIGV
jgi:CHAT domain-containing protein